MTTKTFLRFEKKYILDSGQFATIIDGLREYMVPDRYTTESSGYPIYNIYYDTLQNELIRHSIAKPYYKEKIRLRSYSQVSSPEDMVFLELKRKIGGIVNKRRAQLPYRAATLLLEGKDIPPASDYLCRQVIAEVSEVLRGVDIVGRVMIAYERMAFVSKSDTDFRVTFDRNIVSRRDNLGLFLAGTEAHIIPADRTIMEVKVNGSIPLWLSEMLSSCDVFPQGFSKYGTEYLNYYNAEDTIDA